MSDCGCDIEIKDASQTRVLYWLLAINFFMFFVELSLGWIAESTALMADSLDMLADGIIYSIGLYAVGKAAKVKTQAARASGYFQAVLGLLILADILRRILVGSEPVSMLMISVGMLALVANIICLALLNKHRHGEVHMRASWIFSANDVIANLGVILGGVLVWWLGSRWPDIIVGVVVSLFILRGAWMILQEAKKETLLDTSQDSCCNTGS